MKTQPGLRGRAGGVAGGAAKSATGSAAGSSMVRGINSGISPAMPGGMSRSLNKIAWEPSDGRKVAVGGLDGVVSVFEVGSGLGGREGARSSEWDVVKRWAARLELE